MAKHVVLGNGELLVGFDRLGRVQDLHFPYVGKENHVALNHIHRIGVWSEGQFFWFDDPSWNVEITTSHDTFAGEVTAVNEALRVKLTFTDVVYNEKNIILREVTVYNLDEVRDEREFRVFFGQQFQIAESKRGDTAYFDPTCSAVIHYKGQRAFLANVRMGNTPMQEYSVGLFDIEGHEGTFRDAEDGELGKNPIEHSSVDSVIGIRLSVRGSWKKSFHYWLAVGESIEEVKDLNEYVIDRTPAHLIKTAADFWHIWANRQNFSFHGLSPAVVRLFKQSLFIIRAHADNRGAIIASGDSDLLHHGRDSYHYVWPRDGSRSALALDMAGDANVAQRFFAFCNRVITEKGYFMHKYLPDGSLGSSWHPWVRDGRIELPIQIDETAVVLNSLWGHYELTKDIEFIETVFNTLITRAADFLVEYKYAGTDLPYPTYDLWEEHYGISAYGCAAVYGALRAATNFSSLLGKRDLAEKYSRSAEKLKQEILNHFYNDKRKAFRKMIRIENNAFTYDDTLDISSIAGMYLFGVLPAEDKRITEGMKTVADELLQQNGPSGMPRYQGDMYFTNPGDPANPWIITTMWYVRYFIATAKSERDLEQVRAWFEWAVRHALPSGVLPEQINPHTGAPVGATPLTWSHAEYVITVIEYLNKLEELGICKACNPVKR